MLNKSHADSTQTIMNIQVMKSIDHYLGTPLCLLLDVVKKILFWYPARRITRPPRKILIMKYFGIGSILLASPMLRALKQRYPDATIAFLTFSSNQDIVDRLGQVDQLYLLRTDSILHFSLDVAASLCAIRREHYDITIDMEFFAKFSTIMTFLSGSPMRIGYFLRQLWRGDLLTHQIYYNQFKHVSEIFAALVAPLDVSVHNYSLQPPVVTPEEDRSAETILANGGIAPDDLFIVLNVNASELSYERRWPKEKFQVLSNTLLAELRAKLVFIGGSSDTAYVKEVIADLLDKDRVLNLSGRTKLAELIGIISRCKIFISNDSGPLHVASSLGVPTVSFFGPEIPTLYGPLSDRALVFYESAYCSPCLNVYNAKTAPCGGNNICMQQLTPDRVLGEMRAHFSDIWESFRHEGHNSVSSLQQR